MDEVDTCQPTDRVAHVEDRAMRMLATSRLVELRAAVAAVPAAERPAFLEIADLDAAVRLGAAHLSDVDAVERAIERGAGDKLGGLRPWLTSIRAEYLLWHCDLGAVEVAAPGLDEAPVEALPAVEILVPRARSHRILALVCLLAGREDEARAHLSEATSGFARSRWDDERDLTLVVYSLLRACIYVDGLDVALAVIAEASDALGARRSPHHALSLVATAIVQFLRGDMVAVHAALSELDASPRSASATALVELPAVYLRSLAALIGTAAQDTDALARMGRACHAFRSLFPAGAAMLDATVGNVLVDFGRTADALRWAEQASLGGDAPAAGSYEFQFLRARLALMSPTPDRDALKSLWSLLEEMAARGLRRDAATKALRCARDCNRIGLNRDAALLRSWASGRLPAEGERTVWEHLWAMPVAGSRMPGTPEPEVEVRLLAPRATVVQGGLTRALKGHTARLLAVLVASGGCSTTERLIDQLWPDADVETGRNRLNVTCFRLRRMLGPGAGDALRRTRDLVEFDPPQSWLVDTTQFAAWAGGDSTEQLAALELYQDHLCSQQLAYDDAVSDMRAWLRARLVDLLCDLVANGTADVAMLARRSLALDALDPKLSGLLTSALENAGHAGLADHVVAASR